MAAGDADDFVMLALVTASGTSIAGGYALTALLDGPALFVLGGLAIGWAGILVLYGWLA